MAPNGANEMAFKPQPIRRVVTGNDEHGRSGVLFDSAAPNVNPGAISRGTCMTDLWVYRSTPAVISGTRDDGNLPFHFSRRRPAAICASCNPTPSRPITIRRRDRPTSRSVRRDCVRTASGIAAAEFLSSPVHKSATVDYGILLSGERTLLLDRQTIVLLPGDVVVQLGNWPGWTNVNAGSLMAFVMMGASFEHEPKV